MKKCKYIFLFLICGKIINAQQFPQYTQFTFNKIGYNPASSGTSLAAPFEIIFGARTQYIGVPNNPKSTFVSFNYNFVPPRAYSKWHNVGMYIDQDQNGNFVHNDVWLSYTFHKVIASKTVLAAGVFAGIKQYRLALNNLDRNDPAVQNSAGSIIAYPDIVPGIRITKRNFFAGICLQQVSIYSQKGIGGKIGSPSRVWPHYNFTTGIKTKLNYYNSLVIAANVKGSFTGVPSAELNIMDYVSKLVGFGVSIRNKNFVCGIIQFRLARKFNVGLAYDLAINKMFKAAPHTGEVMIAFTPVFNGETISKKTARVVDDCTF
ncbi:MAG: PorP/SprF family type IX secretion system membrane protein [Sphingobacteriaceae bacterium]|nr:PorP/SprF family type IX secretion system membrane protein [Sphingobacteriaceae bacterium]